MMVMVANQTNAEFGYLSGRHPGCIGHLYSPGGQRGPWHFFPYALDNGAYVYWQKNLDWDPAPWLELLAWATAQEQRPLWALVPDVVMNRDRTLEQWKEWSPVVRARGFRPALAIQDGMTFEDVPDSECMLFLGGSTPWKDAVIGPWCARFPGRVHVGRVNRKDRLHRCHDAGAVSVDGTGWWHKTNGQQKELVDYLRLHAAELARAA
jgi:hypothetical protein